MLSHRFILDFDLNDSSFDNFVIFAAQLENVIAGFASLEVEVPEWLLERQAEVRLELGRRIKAEKQRRLRLLRQRRETLLPEDVKLKNVESEIVELEKELSA